MTSALKTDQEPLPPWCGPVLVALLHQYPQHPVTVIADVMRQALELQRQYHVTTSMETLAGKLLAAG